jgi:hypothetical protein
MVKRLMLLLTVEISFERFVDSLRNSRRASVTTVRSPVSNGAFSGQQQRMARSLKRQGPTDPQGETPKLLSDR